MNEQLIESLTQRGREKEALYLVLTYFGRENMSFRVPNKFSEHFLKANSNSKIPKIRFRSLKFRAAYILSQQASLC